MKKFIYILFLILIISTSCSQESSDSQVLLKYEEVISSGFSQTANYFIENIDNFTETEKLDFANKIILKLEDKVNNFVSKIGSINTLTYRISEKDNTVYLSEDNKEQVNQVISNDFLDFGITYYISDGSHYEQIGLSYMLKPELIQSVNKAFEVTDLDQARIDELKMKIAMPNVYYQKLDEQFNSFEATDKYAEVIIDKESQLDLFLNENVWKTTVYLPVQLKFENMSNLGNQGETEVLNNKTESLLEIREEEGIEVYWSFRSDSEVYFDLDNDGSIEKIVLDTNNYELRVNDEYIVNLPETINDRSFYILRYYDSYDIEMFLVGVENEDSYGNIIKTNLFAFIKPMNEKWFGSVGSISAKIYLPELVNLNNVVDFNTKATLKYGKGIDIPVKIDIFNERDIYGRTFYTYYSTYKMFVDNSKKYDKDYILNFESIIKEAVMLYPNKEEIQGKMLNENTKVTFVSTDNNKWAYIIADDGNSGYVLVKDLSLE